MSPNDPVEDYFEDYYSGEEYYSESDGDSESYRRSPSASPTSRRSPSASRRSFDDASPSRSPTLAPSTTATAAPTASYMSRHSLGSDGSSQRSETQSPTSPKSTLKSPIRNDSAASNQTYSKSLGHSILSRARRSLKSGRTEDLIDHDEDAKNYSHRTLRYGNSFSTKTDERNHDVTVTSQGNGTENNDVESRLNSGGSLFSYKTNSPDVRRPKSKYVCNWKKGLSFIVVFCRPIEVDYDTDDSGLFRAKGSSKETKGAKVILDSTVTKINTPLDLMATQTIDEEQLGNRVKTFRLD